MEHLWRNWPQLRLDLEEARHVLFLTDFDGTLAPIVDHPQNAQILPEAQEALLSLAQLHCCTTGFTSGRSLADLESRVRVPNSHYSGNYGLEWRAEGLGPFRVLLAPNVRERLRQVTLQAVSDLGSIPGVFIEEKRFALSIHYRLVTQERLAEVLEYLDRMALESAPLLEMHTGKRVREIRPAGAPDKGHVLRAMVRAVKTRNGTNPLVCYIGDDEGDEPAFAAVAGSGYGVRVGRPVHNSHARYWLACPEEVANFLRRSAQCLLDAHCATGTAAHDRCHFGFAEAGSA